MGELIIVEVPKEYTNYLRKKYGRIFNDNELSRMAKIALQTYALLQSDKLDEEAEDSEQK
jgi:hypothetical protein